MSAASMWRLLLRGFGWGIAACVIGNLVFGVVGLLTTLAVDFLTYPRNILREFNLLPQDILAVLLFPMNLFFYGMVFSLIPSAFGGVVLVGLLTYLSPRVGNLRYVGTIVGSLVGGVTGVTSSFLAIYFLLGGGAGGLAYLAILAWTIAFIVGGLVGQKLASTCSQVGP